MFIHNNSTKKERCHSVFPSTSFKTVNKIESRSFIHPLSPAINGKQCPSDISASPSTKKDGYYSESPHIKACSLYFYGRNNSKL